MTARRLAWSVWGGCAGVVDGPFCRARDDGGRPRGAFGARWRDELDLESLGADLHRAGRDTVRPVHVMLWLRSTP